MAQFSRISLARGARQARYLRSTNTWNTRQAFKREGERQGESEGGRERERHREGQRGTESERDRQRERGREQLVCYFGGVSRNSQRKGMLYTCARTDVVTIEPFQTFQRVQPERKLEAQQGRVGRKVIWRVF